LPLVDDDRYNPCRRYSKLGVPIGRLCKSLRREPGLLDSLRGLHLHTNCDSASYEPLYRTVKHVEERLRAWLPRLRWINLGGGYLLDPPAGFAPLAEAVALLRSRCDLDVFLEPGAALVRRAGVLVAQVIDLFRSGKKTIAVLDTTINHIPEVFEYQFEPDVLGHDADGDYEYLLAGSSCVAGDVLGEYAFGEPLRLGSRVVLTDVGAYTMVKAHMFNGINLPTVYSVTTRGELVLRRRYTYHDFLSRCGASCDAAL
jgi:carboxynorspermidine decarboxylase